MRNDPAYFRAYYEKHAEKIRQRSREWYHKNRERSLRIRAEWDRKNPERSAAECLGRY